MQSVENTQERVMGVEEESRLFESVFVRHSEQMRRKHGWSKTELARKAFGSSMGASYRAYCRILQVNRRAKPQRLTLHDAYMLARLWYPTFESACFSVAELMRSMTDDTETGPGAKLSQ